MFKRFHILCVKNTCDNMLKIQQRAKTKKNIQIAYEFIFKIISK